MNKCFFSGKIIDIYNFKFIYNSKVKANCVISISLKISSKEIFEILVFDKMIEEVLPLKNEYVYICAELFNSTSIRLLEIYH